MPPPPSAASPAMSSGNLWLGTLSRATGRSSLRSESAEGTSGVARGQSVHTGRRRGGSAVWGPWQGGVWKTRWDMGHPFSHWGGGADSLAWGEWCLESGEQERCSETCVQVPTRSQYCLPRMSFHLQDGAVAGHTRGQCVGHWVCVPAPLSSLSFSLCPAVMEVAPSPSPTSSRR